MTIEVNLSTLVLIAAGLVAIPVWRWIVWKRRCDRLLDAKAEECAHQVMGQIRFGIWETRRDDEFPEIIEDKK